MPPKLSRPVQLNKEEAVKVVEKLINDKDCNYHLLPFKEYQKSCDGSSLKSTQYHKFLVLCQLNSIYHAGWFVCPYVVNGCCPIGEVICEINSKKGITNKFGRHIAEHESKSSATESIERNLNVKCQKSVDQAAAKAVIMDLRPLGFTDKFEGMTAFGEAVFRAGQSTPLGVNVCPSSYLPSRTAVKKALSEIGESLRRKFAFRLQ